MTVCVQSPSGIDVERMQLNLCVRSIAIRDSQSNHCFFFRYAFSTDLFRRNNVVIIGEDEIGWISGNLFVIYNTKTFSERYMVPYVPSLLTNYP